MILITGEPLRRARIPAAGALPRKRTMKRFMKSHYQMAMTSDQKLRMKPQNLLTGLPVEHLEAAT